MADVMTRLAVIITALVLALGCTSKATPASSAAPDGSVMATDAGPIVTSLVLPDGPPGIGFDDLGILGISSSGEPSLLGTVNTAASSTSATDGSGHVFVADPENGGLIRVRDTYPATD